MEPHHGGDESRYLKDQLNRKSEAFLTHFLLVLVLIGVGLLLGRL